MGLLTGTSIYSGSQIPTVGEGGAREIHAERGGLWCARLCNAYPASGSRLASNAGLIPSFCSRSTSNGAIPRENRRMDGGLQHYNHSEHAVFDLKCHVIWCTKHRCKILRGRVAERAARSSFNNTTSVATRCRNRALVSLDQIQVLLPAPPTWHQSN